MACREDSSEDWKARFAKNRQGRAPSRKKGEIERARSEGAVETAFSGSALVIYAIQKFGAPWLLNFLSYLLCLLFGYPSTNNASLVQDPFFKLHHRKCIEIHRSMERMRVGRRLRQLVSAALDRGIINPKIDLSADLIHSPYWGRKLRKFFGTHWSTMMNRPFPGLTPIVGFDLLSKVPVYIANFLGRRKKGGGSDVSAVYARNVLQAIRFLKNHGITVGCFVADRAFTSIDLLKHLAKRVVAKWYILPLKSNSDLKKHICEIKEWFSDGKGNLVGIVRGVDYHGVQGNLIVLRIKRKKHWKRKKTRRLTLLYLTNYNDDNPVEILKRYRRRGSHEGFFGRLSCMGFHQKPGNNSRQIKAHFFLCISLELLLHELREELNLGPIGIKSFSALLQKRGLVWYEKSSDGRKKKRLNTIMLVNRSFIRKIGKTTIETPNMRIRLIEDRGRINLSSLGAN